MTPCPGNERSIKYHPKKFFGYYERIPLFKAPPVKQECGMNQDIEVEFTCRITNGLRHLLDEYLMLNELVEPVMVDHNGVHHGFPLFFKYKNFTISFEQDRVKQDWLFSIQYDGPLGDLMTEGMLDFFDYVALDSAHVNACNLDIELGNLHGLVLCMQILVNTPDNALDYIQEVGMA